MPPPDPTPPPPSSSLASQQFCLRWNNHQSNLLAVFDQLLQTEALVDVTLAVEGVCLKAHKIVLSACSPYFQILFAHTPDKHPIVFLKDVSYLDLKALLDFMYRGEVSVSEDNLNNFLRVAESLRIKGLAEVNSERRLGEVVLPPPPSSIPSPSSAHPPVHSTSLLHSSSLIIPLAPVMSPPPNPPVAHQQPSSRDPHRSGSSSNTLRRSSSSCFMIPPPYLTPKRKRGRPRRVGSTDGMLGKHISTRRGGGRGTMIRTRASFSEEVSENSEGNMMHSPSSASCSSTIKTEPDQPGVSGESPKQKESESKSADGVEGRESVTSDASQTSEDQILEANIKVEAEEWVEIGSPQGDDMGDTISVEDPLGRALSIPLHDIKKHPILFSKYCSSEAESDAELRRRRDEEFVARIIAKVRNECGALAETSPCRRYRSKRPRHFY